MPEYTVEMEGRASGFITVKADDEDEALEKANAQGLELSDISEVTDAKARSVEYFQG